MQNITVLLTLYCEIDEIYSLYTNKLIKIITRKKQENKTEQIQLELLELSIDFLLTVEILMTNL